MEAIQESLPDLSYSTDMVENAVRTAYQTSLQSISWYQDSDHLLTVQPGSETSTHLTIINLLTGEASQLEDEPGFVQKQLAQPGRRFPFNQEKSHLRRQCLGR